VRASASRQPRITPYAPSHRVSPYQLKRGLPPISTVGTGIFFLRLVPNCEGRPRRDSNPQPPEPKFGALPLSLRSLLDETHAVDLFSKDSVVRTAWLAVALSPPPLWSSRSWLTGTWIFLFFLSVKSSEVPKKLRAQANSRP